MITKEREEFIQVYTDFNIWLSKIGFKSTYTSTPLDYHYSHYNELINSLYSVEHYIHDILQISIRFLRDTDKHLFLVVGEMGTHTDLISIDVFKNYIFELVTKIKAFKLKELEELKLTIL